MYFRQLILAILLFVVPFLFGCGPQRPKDMPKTYPCKIILTKSGNPVTNAAISLMVPASLGNVSVVGTTDAKGVAEISSHLGSYSTKGAPAGDFQVIIMEVPSLPEELQISQERLSKMTGPEMDAFRAKRSAALQNIKKELPFSFSDPVATPLKMTVTESKQGTEVSFEVNEYL